MQGVANWQRLVQEDGWQNCLTGLGTPTDKGTRNRFRPNNTLDGQTLSDAYRHNWLARRLVEAVPNRALARGFDEATPMPPQFDDLNYSQWDEGALQRACYFGGLFGGAHLFIGYGSGGEDLTLPPTSKGNVLYLDVFTKHELTPATDPATKKEWRDLNGNSPRAGQVEVWEVTGEHPRKGLKYHHSRALAFGGRSLPPLALTQSYSQEGQVRSHYRQQASDRDWSDSVLQSVWDDVERYGVFWQSVSHLMQVASIGVLKISGLIQGLAHNDGAVMRARVDILNQCLALTRNLLCDATAGEDYDRKSVSFADIPQLLDQQMIATAGAFGMPATELFGRAPQGMNATGEGDRLMWYAHVGEWRKRVLRPRVNLLAEAISGSPTKIDFPEIHQPTDQEIEELRALSVGTDHKLWQMNVFGDKEIRNARQAHVPVEDHATAPEPPEAQEPEPLPGEEPPAPGGAKPGNSPPAPPK